MHLLIDLYPIMLKLVLLLILLLAVIERREIAKQFKKVDRKTWLLLLSIFVFALVLRLFFVPHTPLIYYDEFEHMAISRNLLYYNGFFECRYEVPCSYSNIFPYWPGGFHVLMGLALGAFGDSMETAFNFNAIIGALSVLLFFAFSYLFFQNKKVALWSAFILSVAPVHLKFSGGMSLCVLSLFFMLLSLALLTVSSRSKKFPVFLLFLCSLMYFVNIRPENFFFLFLLPVFAFFFFPDKGRHFVSKKHIAAIAIFLLLLVPLAVTLQEGVAYAQGWADPPQERIFFVWLNIGSNILFFFNPYFNPLPFSIFVLVGLIAMFSKEKKKLAFCLLFFGLFLEIYSSFYAGWFSSDFDSARYSMLLYVPMVLFAAYGVWIAVERLPLALARRVLVVSVVLLFFVWLTPTCGFIHSEPKYAEMHRFILSVEERVPEDAKVLTYTKTIIHSTINRPAVHPGFFIENYSDKLPEKLVVYKNHRWFRNEPEGKEIEEELKKHYSFELLDERPVRNTMHSFHLLTKKAGGA